MEPPVDLERFATLSAELGAGTHKDELCAREGISPADWDASQETWLSRLAEETSRKRFVLTNRYNNAFVARRRALTHGPRFTAQKPAAAPVAPPAMPQEIAPPPPVVVSLPALEVQPPPIVRHEPPPIVRHEPPPIVRREPPAHEPAHAEPETLVRRPIGVRAPTMSMPAFTDVPATPLPFAPARDAESTTIGALPVAPSLTALPFKPTEAAPAVVPPVVAARPPSSPPAPRDNSSTVFGAISPFAAQGAALPFQGAAVPAPRASTPHSNVGLPFQATPTDAQGPPSAAPPAQATPSAATHAPQVGAPAAPSAQRPPPAPPSSPGGGTRLTLEQFASLTAEIAVSPRAAAQIRARYGFDEASHRAEAEEHNRRFTADKALYARYMELFQAYREYVARTPR